MFEGALSPWHLLIIGLVVLLVYGPKKIANHTKSLGEAFQRFADGDDADQTAEPAAPVIATPHGRAYRIGQRLRRRKSR